jgi:hypothetical protein
MGGYLYRKEAVRRNSRQFESLKTTFETISESNFGKYRSGSLAAIFLLLPPYIPSFLMFNPQTRASHARLVDKTRKDHCSERMSHPILAEPQILSPTRPVQPTKRRVLTAGGVFPAR